MQDTAGCLADDTSSLGFGVLTLLGSPLRSLSPVGFPISLEAESF